MTISIQNTLDKANVLLGVQFLKDNNCVIDFANKTIKIGE